MTVPTFRTDRLTLRALREGDLQDVVRYAGDYEVSKWLTHVVHPYTMDDATAFLMRVKAGELGMLWVITDQVGFVGIISIGGELGYWSAPRVWGKGYMTEAGQAIVAHHFATSDDPLIKSSHFVANRGSRRVLQKLGFTDVGGKVHFSQARNADVDGRRMELARERWEALQNG